MVGDPAKQIGWMCECGIRLGENLSCSVCGIKYAKKEGILVVIPKD
jgi:UDP-2-acetamido-3-amino-2,3-dideoxy-glucuronate N-acetyltransferase